MTPFAIGMLSFISISYLLVENRAYSQFEILPLKGNSILSDREFARNRCAPDAQTNYILAYGAAYGRTPETPGLHLFDFVGVDVSRCVFDAASATWWLLSRKVSLYLDKETGKKLRFWTNPFTGETLNVLHRTYDYQEFSIPEKIEATTIGNRVSVSFESSMSFPNPYAALPQFADYSPEPLIQSKDAYKFYFNASGSGSSDSIASDSSISDLQMSYYRLGNWEPWMKMKGQPGSLVLSYVGGQTGSFEELPDLLKETIRNVIPFYEEAPPCRLKQDSATSWNKFLTAFPAYLAGTEFPLSQSKIEEKCL